MRLLTKCLSYVLIFSLLAQSAIATPVTDSPQPRPSLAELQAQAQQDNSWLKEHRLHILEGVSAASIFAVAYLAVRNIQQKKQLKITKKELKKVKKQLSNTDASRQRLNERVQTMAHEDDDILQLVGEQRAKIEKLEGANQRLTNQNRALETQRNGLRRGYDVQSAKRTAAENEIVNLKANMSNMQELFEQQISQLRDDFFLSTNYISRSGNLSPTLEKEIERYSEMFNSQLSKRERFQIWREMKHSPVFKSFSKEEQKEILEIVNFLWRHTGSPLAREGSLYVLTSRTGDFLTKHATPAARFLQGLNGKIFRKGNLLTAGLLIGLGLLPAIDGNAKNLDVISDIDFDFENRFLQATPEELKEWEKDENVYEVCARGVAVRHYLTTLSEEELSAYRHVVNTPTFHMKFTSSDLAY